MDTKVGPMICILGHIIGFSTYESYQICTTFRI